MEARINNKLIELESRPPSETIAVNEPEKKPKKKMMVV